MKKGIALSPAHEPFDVRRRLISDEGGFKSVPPDPKCRLGAQQSADGKSRRNGDILNFQPCGRPGPVSAPSVIPVRRMDERNRNMGGAVV